VQSLQGHEECVEFFKNMLTDQELKSVLNRWEILLLLHQQIPQREIVERLGVGVATVSRGNHVYRSWDGLAKILEKLKPNSAVNK
jgi:Trp operon repressor